MKKLQTRIRTLQTVEIAFQEESLKNNLKNLNHCDGLALKETLESFIISKVSTVLHLHGRVRHQR